MARPKVGFESRLAGVAVSCAIVATSVMVWRQFQPAPPFPAPGARPPVLVDNSGNLEKLGHRVGVEDAPVTLVVFGDVECAACGWLALSGYPQLKEKFGDSISMVYRHFPLERHANSFIGALALECAAKQGNFVAFHDLIYKEQRLLGMKSMTSFAAESGVPDVELFQSCLEDPLTRAGVETDIEHARAFGATGTPAVVVNGWYFPGGVSRERLDSAIASNLRKSSL